MTANRLEAQQRADDIRVFERELARLEAAGVIALDDTARAAIATHHRELLAGLSASFDVDRDLRTKQLSLGMRIASFLGALALAASVFYLFRQFWGRFEPPAQVALLVTAPIAGLVLTLWIKGLDESGYFAKLAALVAFACFVLDLYMLGQMFDITPSDEAFLPWAAFAFLLAYACELRLLVAAGILCLAAFIAARTGTWGGMYWLDFGERPENFFPAALVLGLVPLLPHRFHADFAPVYRVFALLLFLLPVLVLANWGHASWLDLPNGAIEHGYQVLGFVASGLAIWLGAKRGHGDVVNTGLTFFVIFLYTKFFDWWWQLLPKYLFFLVIALFSILILFVLRRLRGSAR
ncbi:MAG: DUF2157 domain-containing protein [Gammaproteobacteria bacterium]|nr:DUF2157 domain-containing protein [Gammaproteobacteria bacterium]